MIHTYPHYYKAYKKAMEGKRMYPPQQPQSGLYRVKILSVLEDDAAYVT